MQLRREEGEVVELVRCSSSSVERRATKSVCRVLSLALLQDCDLIEQRDPGASAAAAST